MFRAADEATRDGGRVSMEQARHGADGAATGRTAFAILRVVLRGALVTLPLLALRAMFVSRGQPLSALSDDIAPPHERTRSADLDAHRMLRGRDWR
jgi:hypothetical protein